MNLNNLEHFVPIGRLENCIMGNALPDQATRSFVIYRGEIFLNR